MKSIGCLLLILGFSIAVVDSILIMNGAVECCDTASSLLPVVGVLFAAVGIFVVVKAT